MLTSSPRQLQTAAKRPRTPAGAGTPSSSNSSDKSATSSELPRGLGNDLAPEVDQELAQQENENQSKESQSWTDSRGEHNFESPRQASQFLVETDQICQVPEDRNTQLDIPRTPDLDGAFPGAGSYLPHPHVLLGSRSWSLRLVPRFVRPLPATMPLEDVEFLQQKGALTIPDTTLREALVQAYLEHVHPLLPVINIEDFVESLIEENEFNLKISLLFLQAVMFAGSAYVDWNLLAEAGFKSRKEARETLYQRVRVRICANKRYQVTFG